MMKDVKIYRFLWHYRRDISAYTKSKATMDPYRIYRGHSAVVEDVDWHAENDYMFASVGDDKKLMM